uniref:EOG090X0BW7 n=1 Tax=Ceriodaphnia reticulata TaxID=302197 RepID=A0A4Y7LW48_9CRUS|nr:EOG090X0BW7 [Ceriodaphnia reticulata]
MSVISSRDPAVMTATSATLTRPGSRSSDSRPIFLLERCLAIRFERIEANPPTHPPPPPPPLKPKPESRPGSSLSQLSSWLPWQRHATPPPPTASSCVSSERTIRQEQIPQPTTPLVRDSSAPAGWVYDGGFVLYQNFQEANGYCYWNGALLEAVTSLKFVGHVTPSTILVTGEESSLETVRSAWARKVLRAPSAYIIVLVGDVDGCAVQPISQSQFTPLPEALCWVIWELNLAERSTALDDVTAALGNAFPDLVPPSNKVVYDTLGKLIRDRKIFYNGKGYGVVTPDTYRKTSVVENAEKGLLLSNEEALTRAHGAVESYPQGNVVHKAIQTNLVDVICRGNGTDKILYGRTAEELAPVASRPRLQRQRSLKMFHGGGSNKRLSWSEYRSGSGGGSLKLSQAKAKKLLEECAHVSDWDEATTILSSNDETNNVPIKNHKEKTSLLSRLFRRRSPSKKRTTVSTFNAQFPPPEWLDSANGKVLHLHSVAVQTQAADIAASADTPVETKFQAHNSSARSECSTSLSFSSPTPTRRSMQRRVTLSQPPSVRSESCSPFRQHHAAIHHQKLSSDETGPVNGRARGSPATSISSGLGRSFSPASAHSYQRPLGILRNQSPPSPTQSTDSLYSSSVGPSASATCRSPVPSLASKTTTFSHDRPFQRSIPARASYGGMGRTRIPPINPDPQPRLTEYQPFQRLSARSVSLRQPRASPLSSPTLLGSSVPRPYVSGRRIGLAEQKSLIAQQRATIRDQFFQTPLTAPPLISSMMSNNIKSKLSLPRTDELSGNGSYSITGKSSPAHSTVSSAGKSYYETDLDLTIKVPKKSSDSSFLHQETRANKNSASSETGGGPASPASRVINISVVKSESLNYVSQQNEANAGHLTTNKENAEDIKADRPNFSKKSSEENFRTFPSLTELNINFKSITGQKILQGLNSNSTDTLVELSMRDGPEVGKSDLGYV